MSKQTPTLRFPEFKGEWEKKKLGEVTTYVDYRGRAPIKTEEGRFLVTAKNIKKGFIDYECSKEFVGEDDYLNVMSKGIPKIGDILFTTEAPMGNVAQLDRDDIALAQRVIKFRGCEIIENNYLLHYMLSTIFQNKISEKAIGTTVQGISGKELHKVNLSFPTLPEQTKIAEFFTAIDAKIQALKTKKEKLQQYKKGVMQQLFSSSELGLERLENDRINNNQEKNPEILQSKKSKFRQDDGKVFPKWEMKKLGEVCEIYDGTHQTPNYVEQGIPFYSVEQLTANDFSRTKFVTQEVFEKENKRVKLEKGDILMTRIGDIGTSRYIDWDVNASFYVSIVLIKQSSKFNSRFIHHFIGTKFFQNELWNRTIHVAFPKKINLGEIGNCLVHLPCIEEQTKIANFLSSLDEKINHTESQIQQMQAWKKGLLQKMFV